MDIQAVLANHKLWLENSENGRADLRSADLSYADLSYANLSGADLSYANLSSANLSSADLRSANLSGANLSGADLSSADLSGTIGLLDPIEWLVDLERTEEGVIAYKSFSSNYEAPKEWKIKAGSILSEVVNPLPTLECSCGINVAKRSWSSLPKTGVWKCLIKWEWLPSVVVPYNTDGKFRCGRAQLIEQVN